MDAAEINKKKKNVALLSIISNSFLVLIKIITGFLIGSVSIISEGMHSGLDLLAAIIAYFAVHLSSNPPDSKYNFGYGKIENISGAAEAVLIFAAAVMIVIEAVKKLINPVPIEQLDLGIVIMFVSMLVNWFVSSRLMKTAKETDSAALEADAWHLRTDIYTSLGVLLGLLLIRLTGIAFLDPLFALGVAFIIAKVSYSLTKEAIKDLLDRRLNDDEEALIRKIIDQNCPCSQLNFHKLRTRKSGKDKFIDLHLMVPPHFTVGQAHEMAHCIENSIAEAVDNVKVLIHIEPYLENENKENPSDK